jgi:hypothetical protein
MNAIRKTIESPALDYLMIAIIILYLIILFFN